MTRVRLNIRGKSAHNIRRSKTCYLSHLSNVPTTMPLKDNNANLPRSIVIPYHVIPAAFTEHHFHLRTQSNIQPQEQGTSRVSSNLLVLLNKNKNTLPTNFLTRSSTAAEQLAYVATVLETAILIVDENNERHDDPPLRRQNLLQATSRHNQQ